MKLSITVLLSVIAVIQGAAIENEVETSISRKVLAPDSLFEKAWEFHDKFNLLQGDINEKLTEIRTSVSRVLKLSSNVTLGQIELNANQILALADPARLAIFNRDLAPTSCVVTLRGLLNGATEFSGFGSSNCVTVYDRSLNGVLNTAYALLQKFEGNFGNVQQVVVRAFSGQNTFLHADAIEARFESEYIAQLNGWNAVRPDIDEFVKNLSDNVAVLNTVLGGCFTRIQDDVTPAFAKLQAELATCEAFDNTVDPFPTFNQP